MENLINCNGVSIKLDSVDNQPISCIGWFINELSNNKWEPETFQIFEKVKNENLVAVDIGGWIGVTGIWLSKKFKKVMVVEADKIACEVMRKNLVKNSCDNVEVIEKCIFSQNQKKVFFGKNSYSPQPLGDSMSQYKLSSEDSNDYEIETITISDILDMSTTEKIGFIKVDIEGAEEVILEELLDVCVKNKIKIFISFHIGWWKDKNVKRFESLFGRPFKIYFDGNLIEEKYVTTYLENRPFGSFFFDFE